MNILQMYQDPQKLFRAITVAYFFYKNGPHFPFILVFSWTNYNYSDQTSSKEIVVSNMGLNRGTQVSEATALSTAPQPRPIRVAYFIPIEDLEIAPS